MSFSKIKPNLELQEIYGNSLVTYSNNSDWKINVIFFFSESETIENIWRDVSSAVSVVYQSGLTQNEEFEKWNLYIIFVCSDSVSKDLKSKIENDKFSSRKIVEDNFKTELTEVKANEIISRHITNTDLVDVVNETQDNTKDEYLPLNPNYWKLIPKDSLLSGKVELQKKILSQFEILENEI
ncbi:MAG: ABC-three component system middle component 1 [Bacteroidota bacterium]